MTGKSRKSDARPRPAAQSDVSAARFVLADDDTAMTNDAPPAAIPIAPAPARPAPAAPQPTPSSKAAATPASTPAPIAAAAAATTEATTSHRAPSSVAPGLPASVTASSPQDRREKSSKSAESDAVTIEDLALPKSIITRLAKGVLPANTQIQANAILALTKSATVFINYLANASNEHTVSSGKKTIMPADVFRALEDTEMGFMKERLEAEFAKFNQVQTSKRSTYRKKVAAAKRASTGAPGEEEEGGGEASFMSAAANGDGIDTGDTTAGLENRSFATAGAATATPVAGAPGVNGGQARAAKKARVDGGGASKMEVDDQEEPSDAETVPDEPVEEDDEEDEEAEEEEEEEEEEEDGADEGEEDDLEEREGAEDGDEALDDDSD